MKVQRVGTGDLTQSKERRAGAQALEAAVLSRASTLSWGKGMSLN